MWDMIPGGGAGDGGGRGGGAFFLFFCFCFQRGAGNAVLSLSALSASVPEAVIMYGVVYHVHPSPRSPPPPLNTRYNTYLAKIEIHRHIHNIHIIMMTHR